jgi:hypothetical protein
MQCLWTDLWEVGELTRYKEAKDPPEDVGKISLAMKKCKLFDAGIKIRSSSCRQRDSSDFLEDDMLAYCHVRLLPINALNKFTNPYLKAKSWIFYKVYRWTLQPRVEEIYDNSN